MVKARKYVVKKHFDGLPKREDFEIVEEELPPLKNGQILLKAEWISVDPGQRIMNRIIPVEQLPYDQLSYQVGLVIDSKDPRYPVGTRIVSYSGWCDYSLIDTSEKDAHPTAVLDRNSMYKLPNLKGLSNSLAVGAVGMPGASAYCGFVDVCQPKPGETVVVSSAAGAVGSLVGQIAKIKGCKVIGLAGSAEKVKWLEELGFDKAINYKTEDIETALKKAAPEGVDIYFDNVGGEVSHIIINQMRRLGRVLVCGGISSYNETEAYKESSLLFTILLKSLRVIGFGVYDYLDRWENAFVELTDWIKSGKLKTREHVTEGFDKIYDAFVGMLQGENVGKTVVKV